jgi:hypothetical protein
MFQDTATLAQNVKPVPDAHSFHSTFFATCLSFYVAEKRGVSRSKGRTLTVSVETGLRRVFGPRREERTGGLRKLCSGGSWLLYLTKYFRVIKSTRMRWMRNVERKGEEKMRMVLEAELKDRGHFEDQTIGGKLN